MVYELYYIMSYLYILSVLKDQLKDYTKSTIAIGQVVLHLTRSNEETRNLECIPILQVIADMIHTCNISQTHTHTVLVTSENLTIEYLFRCSKKKNLLKWVFIKGTVIKFYWSISLADFCTLNGMVNSKTL